MPATKRPGDDLEGSAKKKNANSSRTGQACDRCKIRKIRCDARPGGCSPCIQNNTECRTTDRITGRATARGHIDQLEDENTSLKMHMVELQQQLREAGLEPKAPSSMSQSYMAAGASFWDNEDSQTQQQSSWGSLSGDRGFMQNTGRGGERRGSASAALPDFRPGCIGDNYLGVSSGNNWLSPIEGTSLALFGMKIDVAEFIAPESDPMASPMSYHTFLAHAMGKAQPTQQPALPPYEEFKLYADWYFKSVQIFIPIIHRPDFMQLLSNVFDRQYQPSIAETVMLHMVVAIMKFQYYSRNPSPRLRGESMSHYLYALSLIPDLITGHSLPDIQALVLICSQLRNQPRPGAAWMFTNAVFGIAVEIGLHRSANNWQGSASERDPHIIEMRKRIFWTILLLLVNIGGKLGRPMPIRLEDFDIEIPEAKPDHLPGETNLSKWRKCSFRAAIDGFKALQILMQAYSTVYAIRPPPEPYDLSVRNIEKQLSNFREQLPPELTGGPQTVEEDRIPALHLQHYEQMTRLVLRHPALCRSSSPHLTATNLDVCLDASQKLLTTAIQLKELKGLDLTWMQATDLLAAIFTSLFVHTQRQEQISAAELQKLRQDMNSWLDVMGEMGQLLGAGTRLREAVKQIVDTSISHISRNLAAKTANAGLASRNASDSPSEESPRQLEYNGTNGLSHTYTNGTSGGDLAALSQENFAVPERAVDNHHNYSANHQMYSEAQPQSLPAYPPNGLNSFDTSAFNGSGTELKPNVANHDHRQLTPNQNHNSHGSVMPQPPPQQANHHPHPNGNGQMLSQHHTAAAQPPPQSFMPAFSNGFHPTTAAPHLDFYPAGPIAWRTFTDNMITNMGAPEYLSHHAGALMGLGGGDEKGVDLSGGLPVGSGVPVGHVGPGVPIGGPGLGTLQMPDQHQQQTWPLLQYSSGAGLSGQ